MNSRHANGTYPRAPKNTQVRREVTHDNIKTGTLPHNYTEDTDEYYLNTSSGTKRNLDMGVTLKRSFSEESPLDLKNTFSSLSKEDTFSDGMEEINLGNTNSIFRPRQDLHSTMHKENKAKQSEHLPNLLSHSNLDGNDGTRKYYAQQPDLQAQVTNSINASFDYSAHSNHPVEVMINPRNKRRKLDSDYRLERLPAAVDYYKVFHLFGQAFEDFTYLLPGLKPFVHNPSVNSHDSKNAELCLTQSELTIVKRRLHSAVFAFGGNITTKAKLEKFQDYSFENPWAMNYGQKLNERFYENVHRISWDVEENVPIEIDAGLKGDDEEDAMGQCSFENDKSRFDKAQLLDTEDSMQENKKLNVKRSPDTPKTRYRCKLCGQPKQNHICPYQQSLQRSIGTMSYPALNSFECAEPGKLAPSLSDMNNFFHNLDDSALEFNDSKIAESKNNLLGNAVHLVSPDKTGDTNLKNQVDKNDRSYIALLKTVNRKLSIQSSFVKRSKDECSSDALMRTSVELKPEQCREVSVRISECKSAFVYPSVPLPYLQRSSLSDSLFNLCKERFGLVEEASHVLDDAKISDEWDLAVAELIAQVLLILYCPSGDRTVEGLRKYLLTMGIAS